MSNCYMNTIIKQIFDQHKELVGKKFKTFFTDNYPDLYKDIVCYTKNIIESGNFRCKFQYQLALYYYEIKDWPNCKNCGKKICRYRYADLEKLLKDDRYLTYCSQSCLMQGSEFINECKKTFISNYGIDGKKDIIKKQIQTNLERYGVEHPSQLKEFVDKAKNTCIQRYGVEHVLKLNSFKKKQIQTNLERYGVEHPSQLKEFVDKAKNTCIERFGYDSASKNKDIYDKIKKTNLERYGVEIPTQCKEIQEKCKKTNLEKYGVEYTFQSENIKDKIRKTNLERYGVEVPIQCKEIQEKCKKTNLEKYGVEYAQQNDLIKKKIQDTCIEKYGVKSISQSNFVKNIIKKNNLQKYGVESTSKLDCVKQKNIQTNLQRYGVKYTFQSEQVKSKIKETNLQKYGVENVSKNPLIHKKQIFKIIQTKRLNSYLNLSSDKYDVKLISSLDEYIDYCNNKRNTIKWICKKCGSIFESNKNINWYCLARCYNCYPYIPSIQENNIIDFIKSFNIITERNRRNILKTKELDIYLPNKNIAIEYDGLYWHNEIYKDQNYHLNKTNECNQHNIQLIHIFEDEWIYQQDIVKSRLKSLFNIYDKKIYGRLCEIKKVDNSTKKDFLINNHLQGDCNSKINIGLYYNNELVSLMTFGENRFLKNKDVNEYELLRFCNKLNYCIIGGAGKLLSYFEKKYNPKILNSYADRRWSIGNLYNKLGFTFLYNTKPNYYYVINDKRQNRFKYRKSQLQKIFSDFNTNKTEEQMMHDHGFFKIYDCGSMLFQKKYKKD